VIRFLLIVLLIGSPREIANRPVRRGKIVELPPLPKSVPIKAVKAFVAPPKRYWLVWSNSNPSSVKYSVEVKNGTNQWTIFQMGIHPAFSEDLVEFWPTQTSAIYRVGFSE
jgi:hypothetical protein